MRTHDAIGQLACALAKAQIELVNPPKSLTAHLEGPGNGSLGQRLCPTLGRARYRPQDPWQARDRGPADDRHGSR
jgi:hypothetical protein